MQSYLQQLDVRVRQSGEKAKASRVFVMQSSGGITSLETAARQPVRTVLSGPAGGVVGAAAMARLSGFERVITFDMGGTSTDVALVDGEPKARNDAEIDGLPVRVPMLDIHTVGAGGGSLARFDAGGALRVGPESAGADPGPICYGRAVQPTVTDANLLLGRLQPDKFLGGTFSLDLQRTRAITAEWLKQQGSRMTTERFAEGVIRVVNANMERALRVVSVERGYDPRQFCLVAFGGAGALHACELASALSIPRVLVPLMPGALSAFGILTSDIVKDYSRTVMMNVDAKSSLANLFKQYELLERNAQRDFHEEGWHGKLALKRTADVRYKGQGYELNIPFGKALVSDFHQQHHSRYGFSHPGRAVELVTLRVRAVISSPRVTVRKRSNKKERSTPEKRRIWCSGRTTPIATYEREHLNVGSEVRGPAMIAEYSATTFVPPGFTARIERTGNLLLYLSGKRKGAR